MPARKKDPSIRARANRATTARTVSASATKPKVPALPDHPTAGWHAETVKWWRELWESPLPQTWQSFDLGSVVALALCFNDIWIAESATARKEALSEYRLQRKDFFIAPYNRLQGEITIEEADAAKDRGQRRRRTAAEGTEAKKAPAKKAVDPRAALYAVN